MFWAALVVMVAQPVSIVVPVPEGVRHAATVTLRMEGVIMRRDAPATWNVFWEKQDEAHLIGYISSPANAGARDPKPANFRLQLPEAAVTAIHQHADVRLVFVPVRKLPEGGVTITAVRLE